MSRVARGAVLLALCLVIVAGLVLTGCGKKEAALQQPGVGFTGYVKGATVDFDENTYNSMAVGGGEGGFKFGLMKSVYYTIWNTNKDAVAQALFPAPYWRGDGVNTYYSYLTSADQTAVDTYIFGNYIPGKGLSQAEQAVVTTAVQGFFDRQAIDTSNAKALTATSFYQTLLAKVGQTAADGWKADVEAAAAGVSPGTAYADLSAIQKQYVIAMADPIGLFYKWMVWFSVADGVAMGAFAGKHYSELSQVEKDAIEATIDAAATAQIPAGAAGFMNGVAAATYPEVADNISKTDYGKAYATLDAATEAPVVNAKVFMALASGFADDAARATARANMAYGLKALGYIASDNYSSLNYVDKARVDQAVYGTLKFGTALERDYVELAAVTGAVLKFVAEMSDAVPIEQSICYLKLNSQSCSLMPPNNTGMEVCYPTTTAAKGFKTDVESGTLVTTAFYRWLAKEKVKEMGSSAVMIRESLGEFYIKITNPNDYYVRVDEMRLYFRTIVEGSEEPIDGARQVLGDIWLPPRDGDVDGAVEVKVLAATKTFDLLSWLAVEGVDTNKARSMANKVFDNIQNGSIVWSAEVQAKVSHADEIRTYTYTDLTIS